MDTSNTAVSASTFGRCIKNDNYVKVLTPRGTQFACSWFQMLYVKSIWAVTTRIPFRAGTKLTPAWQLFGLQCTNIQWLYGCKEPMLGEQTFCGNCSPIRNATINLAIHLTFHKYPSKFYNTNTTNTCNVCYVIRIHIKQCDNTFHSFDTCTFHVEHIHMLSRTYTHWCFSNMHEQQGNDMNI